MPCLTLNIPRPEVLENAQSRPTASPYRMRRQVSGPRSVAPVTVPVRSISSEHRVFPGAGAVCIVLLDPSE